MNKKNILPPQSKPVIRKKTAGQLPSHLAELSEEALGGGVEASMCMCMCMCSYDAE